MPILDTNKDAHSYTHLHVNKPYIALNSETYISLTQQELRSCKKIGDEFCCEELFIVKHKSSYSCESAIYFNLSTDIIRNNCNFDFYYKTDIKNFFLNKIMNIFTFTSSIISIITITLVIYLLCKHKHIRTIVASLLLYKAREVEARATTKIDDSECGALAYIGIALTLLSMAIVILLHYRKSKFCRGHRFSNIVKIVLFISDVQYYIPIKICKTSGGHFRFNWDKIKLMFNSNEIKLPKLVTIKIQDKIRVRRMMSREMQNFHIMVKQGMTWYILETA